jgi:hypothetical protein
VVTHCIYFNFDFTNLIFRATIISSEGEKYRVDSGDNMLDIDETDIVKFQGSDIELKVMSWVFNMKILSKSMK